jgi:hypothetical protein
MKVEPLAWPALVGAAVYLALAAAGVEWGPLDRWQDEESYQRWSGVALALLIAAQVVMAWRRKSAKAIAARQLLRAHRVLGLLALPVLWLHATAPGHGLLLGLGLLLPCQVMLGGLRPAGSDAAALQLRRWWRAAHGVLAALLVAGTLLHLYLVYAYS